MATQHLTGVRLRIAAARENRMADVVNPNPSPTSTTAIPDVTVPASAPVEAIAASPSSTQAQTPPVIIPPEVIQSLREEITRDLTSALGTSNEQTAERLRQIEEAQLAASGNYQELARRQGETIAQLQRRIDGRDRAESVVTAVTGSTGLPRDIALSLASKVTLRDGETVDAATQRYLNENAPLVEALKLGVAARGSVAPVVTPAASATPVTAPVTTDTPRVSVLPAAAPVNNPQRADASAPSDARGQSAEEYARTRAGWLGANGPRRRTVPTQAPTSVRSLRETSAARRAATTR